MSDSNSLASASHEATEDESREIDWGSPDASEWKKIKQRINVRNRLELGLYKTDNSLNQPKDVADKGVNLVPLRGEQDSQYGNLNISDREYPILDSCQAGELLLDF